MPFNRGTIGRIIRNMGAAAMRAAADRIAKLAGIPSPKSTDEARKIVSAAFVNPIDWRQEALRAKRAKARLIGIQELEEDGVEPPPRTSTMAPPRSTTLPGGTYRTQAEPPRPGEESEYGEEILTPASTNVYSFSYIRQGGLKLGTLYVTFKAHTVSNTAHGHGVKGGRKSRRQLLGTSGKTVGGKTNQRGATYAYYRVPPGVYSRLKSVKDAGGQEGPGVKSPGTGVWEMLRVRGTVWGHKYTYALVQGQVTPEQAGVYIARRATKGGFRTRSIADLGRGQRGFQTSTLPQQAGFRTRTGPRK